jgi:hypothetical protein
MGRTERMDRSVSVVKEFQKGQKKVLMERLAPPLFQRLEPPGLTTRTDQRRAELGAGAALQQVVSMVSKRDQNHVLRIVHCHQRWFETADYVSVDLTTWRRSMSVKSRREEKVDRRSMRGDSLRFILRRKWI